MIRRLILWLLTRAFGPWSPSLSALGAAPTLAWVWSGRYAHLADLRRLPRPWERALSEVDVLAWAMWIVAIVSLSGIVDAHYCVLVNALILAALADRAEEVRGGR